jgi:hypothetical protein
MWGETAQFLKKVFGSNVNPDTGFTVMFIGGGMLALGLALIWWFGV